MSDLPKPQREPGVKPWLQVNSLDELVAHEQEILKRIESTPNGGHLFLIHPFMLLRDIGVELSERGEQDIRQQQPRITGLSAIPYTALKNSKDEQNVHFHLSGLFERRKES